MSKEITLPKLFRYIKSKKVIIFGAGTSGQVIAGIIPSGVAYFVDNNSSLWGKTVNNMPIKSPVSLLNEEKEQIIVLIGSMYYKEIVKQLRQYGFHEQEQFWNVYWLYENIKKSEEIYSYQQIKSDFDDIKKLSLHNERGFDIDWDDRWLCIGDDTNNHAFDTHYLYHPAWAARILATIRPEKHIDISSTLAFSTIVSAFIPIEYYEYRPANIKLNNFSSKSADLLSLPFEDSSVDSLSCMHVIEHIGLGRYGDPIDSEGDLKAIRELKRVLSSKGDLIFVVPLGSPKIQFNAHRIYSYEQIMGYFGDMKLMQFDLIPDDAESYGIIQSASVDVCNQQKYGCGCFWFRKDQQ